MTNQPNTPNEEIEKALKEFETKVGGTHPIVGVITPQNTQTATSNGIEGVNFENESYGAIKYYKETVEPKMVKAVIKYSGGAVKNQRQAELVLLAFVMVAMGISIFLLFKDIIHFPSPQNITPGNLLG